MPRDKNSNPVKLLFLKFMYIIYGNEVSGSNIQPLL